MSMHWITFFCRCLRTRSLLVHPRANTYPSSTLRSFILSDSETAVPDFWPLAHFLTVAHSAFESSSDKDTSRASSTLKSHSCASSSFSSLDSRAVTMAFLRFAINPPFFLTVLTFAGLEKVPVWLSMAVLMRHRTESSLVLSCPSMTISWRASTWRCFKPSVSLNIPSATIWTLTSLNWKASVAPTLASMASVMNLAPSKRCWSSSLRCCCLVAPGWAVDTRRFMLSICSIDPVRTSAPKTGKASSSWLRSSV
mmetsp:Transcript_16556/g.45870  ORF Transcript_16556/g.45870 Transcript_16556/m.45870 type:complete len:253 (+) Transcript_16556:22-780(+)